MASPGEFTARAYLNGKIDLAQAEAVCEIIMGSNKFQIDAAQKLLAGRLSETTIKARENLMDCISLIEASLDFSGEDIEFITHEQAAERLAAIKAQLEQLISSCIGCETVIDLPSVAIAGAPNAGKSSLLNKLLGTERSIVSPQRKTTRDVLTGVLELKTGNCVLFDCAGLTAQANDILDELAQQAAIEAIRSSSMVLYCVDVSKTDWAEDILIRKLINAEVLLPVATKADLLIGENLKTQLAKLEELFGFEFLPISSTTGTGIDSLREDISEKLVKLMSPATEAVSVALTERHKRAVEDAIENIAEAIKELEDDNDEVAAMMLRAAIQSLSGIEHEHIDEKLFDRIFSRFCIGK
jgi:tRNA modification GTPase